MNRCRVMILSTGLMTLLNCSNLVQMAGTITDTGNPGTVKGEILDEKGAPAANAMVRLRPSDYVMQPPALAKSAIFGADALTDSSGRFEIADIEPGAYCIEVSDTASGALFTCMLGAGQSLNLGKDTLRPWGAITGVADSVATGCAGRYVQVYGIDRIAALDNAGRFSLTSLPAGVYTLRIAGPDSTVCAASRFAGISVGPAETISMSAILPAPWLSVSIGNESPTGSVAVVDGRLVVAGGGPDIWGRADGFFFVYQPLRGNGEITAGIERSDPVTPFDKAGIMMRASLDPNSSHVSLCFESSLTTGPLAPGVELFSRRIAGDTTLPVSQRAGLLPLWVRLQRMDSICTGSVSPDGIVWQVVASDTIPFGQTVYAGLCVSSHDALRIKSAVFDSVAITPGP